MTSLVLTGGLRLPAPPLDEKKLEKARNQRKRDLLMKRCVRDILVNIIIIWILFSISFSNRDVKSYYMHQEVIDRILQPVNMPSFSAVRFEAVLKRKRISIHLSDEKRFFDRNFSISKLRSFNFIGIYIYI